MIIFQNMMVGRNMDIVLFMEVRKQERCLILMHILKIPFCICVCQKERREISSCYSLRMARNGIFPQRCCLISQTLGNMKSIEGVSLKQIDAIICGTLVNRMEGVTLVLQYRMMAKNMVEYKKSQF